MKRAVYTVQSTSQPTYIDNPYIVKLVYIDNFAFDFFSGDSIIL